MHMRIFIELIKEFLSNNQLSYLFRVTRHISLCSIALACSYGTGFAASDTLYLGLAYDRSKSGHGFDLHTFGDQYQLFFYTYDDAGQPEWYIGFGTMESKVLEVDLLKFSYDPSQSPPQTADPLFNGTLRLDYNNAEESLACNDGVERSNAVQLAQMTWSIDGEQSIWCTERLQIGDSPSIPYTGGVWYAGLTDPGYGLTLNHFNQFTTVVFYYYDSAGKPRWVIGSAEDGDPISLDHVEGYCRSCLPMPIQTINAGSIQLDWDTTSSPNDGFDTAVLELSYPIEPFGSFNKDFTLNRLSDGNPFVDLGNSLNAASYYSEFISDQIIQANCIACHKSGGLAANTPLVYVDSAVGNYLEMNLDAIKDYVLTTASGASLILDKPSGQTSHGGGAVLTLGSELYLDWESFINLILSETDSFPDGNLQMLLQGIESLDALSTLQKAVQLFAGREPTLEEEALLDGEDSDALISAITESMSGDNFHQFLTTAANDRLLTDALLQDVPLIRTTIPFYPNFLEAAYEVNTQYSDGNISRQAYEEFYRNTRIGTVRAPLEHIAYVVENDLPYTNILTDNFTMVNPWTATAYGSDVIFNDPNNANEWQPGQIVNYLRRNESLDFRCFSNRMMASCLVLSGGIETDYPHAGILNNLALLARYPSTTTNRNRARARWTYNFFLGVDIEKLAERPIDAAALTDTDNPTLNNPSCSVCHAVHDPVAGAYQNYGDRGYYKSSAGGQDSLPNSYKYPEGDDTQYNFGDVWYADMRSPGFENSTTTDTEASLQWLANEIVDDPRFAPATVKFWWPSIFSSEPSIAPVDPDAANYNAHLIAYRAQEEFVTELADSFSNAPSQNYRLKTLLATMASSEWFRASSINNISDEQSAQLSIADIGTEKLLTPEQLDSKLTSKTAYDWNTINARSDEPTNVLTQLYNLYFGGIDSDGITVRARETTPLMTRVVASMAANVSCPIVSDEFSKQASQRALFKQVSVYDSPFSLNYGEYVIDSNEEQTATRVNLDSLSASGDLSLNLAHLVTGSTQGSLIHLGRLRIIGINNTIEFDSTIEDILTTMTFDENCSSIDTLTHAAELLAGCIIELPITLSAASQSIELTAWHLDQGDTSLVMQLVNKETQQPSMGQIAIKQTLVYLHQSLLNQSINIDSSELNQSYNLFVDLWASRIDRQETAYLDNQCGTGQRPIQDLYDPFQLKNTWVAMIAYFLNDYRFVHS